MPILGEEDVGTKTVNSPVPRSPAGKPAPDVTPLATGTRRGEELKGDWSRFRWFTVAQGKNPVGGQWVREEKLPCLSP